MKASLFFGTAVLFAVIILTVQTGPYAQQLPFPSYGSGAVEVRIYSDYLCPPCQQLEPTLEPVLRKLIGKKNIKLIFVDIPGHPGSMLYARYCLYALFNNNSVEQAIYVRGVLFRAAYELEFTTREKLEGLLASRKMGYTAFDIKPVFQRYNALISEDHIDTTPTCVIVRKGKKDRYTGAAAVAKALEDLI